MDALVWNKDKEFYLFYILNDQENSANKETFYKLLSDLICSYELEINPSKVLEEDSKEYLTKLEVKNIEEFLDENYMKYYDDQENLPSYNINNINNINDEENLIDINKISEQIGKKIEIKTFNFKKTYPNTHTIFCGSGILLRYDSAQDELEKISKEAIFNIYKLNNFDYYIAIDDIGGKQTFTYTQISQETNLLINKVENCVLWLSKDSNVTNAYNFIFYEKDNLEILKKLLTRSQYEANNQNNFDELKEEDRKWLENVNNCELDNTDNSVLDIEMDLQNDFQESETGGRNHTTAQAYLHDRTFVVREDKIISVYKTDEKNNFYDFSLSVCK